MRNEATNQTEINQAATDNNHVNRVSLLPSSQLAPLAEIMSAQFHIDVSRDEALIVQTNTGTEFPLSLLSVPEADEIREKACNQYVKSVLNSRESIDQDRATLFFISHFCDKNSRVTLQPDPNRHNRKNHRTAPRAAERSVIPSSLTTANMKTRVSACS